METTANNIWRRMIEFGDVRSLKLVTDSNGRSKGYGFASFYREEDAERAIKELNEKTIVGKQWMVTKLIRGKKEGKKENNIYVKHLPDGITETELETHFSKYGKILSLMLSPSDKGLFGFICFADSDGARSAIAENGSYTIDGAAEPIYICLAKTKEEREFENVQRIERLEVENASKTVFCTIMYNSKDEFSDMTEKDIEDIVLNKVLEDLHKLFSNDYRPENISIILDKSYAFLTLCSQEDRSNFLTNIGGELDTSTAMYVKYNAYMSKTERAKIKQKPQIKRQKPGQLNDFSRFEQPRAMMNNMQNLEVIESMKQQELYQQQRDNLGNYIYAKILPHFGE